MTSSLIFPLPLLGNGSLFYMLNLCISYQCLTNYKLGNTMQVWTRKHCFQEKMVKMASLFIFCVCHGMGPSDWHWKDSEWYTLVAWHSATRSPSLGIVSITNEKKRQAKNQAREMRFLFFHLYNGDSTLKDKTFSEDRRYKLGPIRECRAKSLWCCDYFIFHGNLNSRQKPSHFRAHCQHAKIDWDCNNS